jgi:chromosome segregation ATPase
METQTSAAQGIRICGDRSESSRIQERKLRGELEKIGQCISRVEGNVAELEADRSRVARSIAIGEVRFHQGMLEECIRRINNTRESSKAYEEERAKTEQAIAALTPTPEQIKARQALQQEFMELAKERLKKTRQVQELLRELRQALQERIELAGKMRNVAKGLECEISGDDLDERRFEDCLAFLPNDLLSASEEWHHCLETANN